MLAADEKQTALQTIQAVVTAIAQNHYAAIPTLLSRSDLPMEELQGEIERVLRFQKTTVAPFSEAFADFYEDEDGAGFEIDYRLTESLILTLKVFSEKVRCKLCWKMLQQKIKPMHSVLPISGKTESYFFKNRKEHSHD